MDSGYGGGFNERENVEYIEREESDGEYDEVSTISKKMFWQLKLSSIASFWFWQMSQQWHTISHIYAYKC